MSGTSWHLYAGLHTYTIGRILGRYKVSLSESSDAARQEICPVEASCQSQIAAAHQDIIISVDFQLIVAPTYQQDIGFAASSPNPLVNRSSLSDFVNANEKKAARTSRSSIK